MDLSNTCLGFIGCGKISSAMCRGYGISEGVQRPKKIFVSERSAEKSRQLAAEFPDLVVVCSTNEEIVLSSDIVFIGLLPSVAREELPKMPWSDKHFVLSMMAAVNYEDVASLISLPQSSVVRIVPLPSSARKSGPILLYPRSSLATSLLGIVGTPVTCEDEAEMKPLISITGHISPFFEMMRSAQSFLLENGVSEEASRSFVSSFYASLAESAAGSSSSFEEMAIEAATPGGLNEQSLRFLSSSDHYPLFQQSLLAILTRLRK